METNTKEIKITPPEGFEIDRENSTFNCIKFKPIIKRWRDDETAIFNGYIIATKCEIKSIEGLVNTSTAYDVYATEKQAKSALAMARISQIIANDKRFGGAITDKEWNNISVKKFVINRKEDHIYVDCCGISYYFLAFHTYEQRALFLKENEDLIKDYLMIE